MQSSTFSDISFPLPSPGSPFSDRDPRDIPLLDNQCHQSFPHVLFPATPPSTLNINPNILHLSRKHMRDRDLLQSARDDECLSSVSVDPSPPTPPNPSAASKRLRRYVCTSAGCGKSFAKKWNLQAHERLHTGYKPFTCRLGCGERHMWMSSLKSHERRKCPLLPEPLRLRRKARTKKGTRSYAARKLETETEVKEEKDLILNANLDVKQECLEAPLYATPTTSSAKCEETKAPQFLPVSLLMPGETSTPSEASHTTPAERVKSASASTEEQIVFELESILAK